MYKSYRHAAAGAITGSELEIESGHPLSNTPGRDTDNGCELHKSCLSCPYEACRHDNHGADFKQMNAAKKTALIIQTFQRCGTVTKTAKKLGICRKTIVIHLGDKKQRKGLLHGNNTKVAQAKKDRGEAS